MSLVDKPIQSTFALRPLGCYEQQLNPWQKYITNLFTADIFVIPTCILESLAYTFVNFIINNFLLRNFVLELGNFISKFTCNSDILFILDQI